MWNFVLTHAEVWVRGAPKLHLNMAVAVDYVMQKSQSATHFKYLICSLWSDSFAVTYLLLAHVNSYLKILLCLVWTKVYTIHSQALLERQVHKKHNISSPGELYQHDIEECNPLK